MKTRILLGVIVLAATTGLCQAGWLDSTIEGVGKRLGNRAVNDAGNSAYDATREGLRDTVKGKPAGERDTPSSSPTSSRKSQQRQTATDEPVAAGPVSIEEAETVYTKFDFIPGDKTLFYDDFSDTDVGEFPRKWTLDGPKSGGNNTVDVVEYRGKRFLRSVPGERQNLATQYLRLNQKGDLPEKFTIEFDAVLGTVSEKNRYVIAYKLLLVPADKKVNIFGGNAVGAIYLSGSQSSSANTKTDLKLNDGQVHHVAISINGTFVKAYIDNQRVVNDPDGVKRPIKQVGLQMITPNYFRTERLMFTNFRLAAGGKDIKSSLDTDGKIITHGILFDTGKDTLKAESLPTLKMILGLLNDDPELKFSIEGHTDSQGSKGINQPLSEGRAAAVKNWLEGKGIDSGRLRTAGFGDSKPIDSNKTAEGRANNRRVEFVKF